MEKELICIGCPIGCSMTVFAEEEGEERRITVSGNTCKKGREYAVKEITNPTRIVTSTVRVRDGEAPVVPVKTQNDIPKDKIAECIREIKSICVQAPVRAGDCIIENTAGTGVRVIATKSCGQKLYEKDRHDIIAEN